MKADRTWTPFIVISLFNGSNAVLLLMKQLWKHAPSPSQSSCKVNFDSFVILGLPCKWELPGRSCPLPWSRRRRSWWSSPPCRPPSSPPACSPRGSAYSSSCRRPGLGEVFGCCCSCTRRCLASRWGRNREVRWGTFLSTLHCFLLCFECHTCDRNRRY